MPLSALYFPIRFCINIKYCPNLHLWWNLCSGGRRAQRIFRWKRTKFTLWSCGGDRFGNLVKFDDTGDCCTMLYNVLQCCTMFYIVVQCCTCLYKVIQCCTMLYNVVQWQGEFCSEPNVKLGRIAIAIHRYRHRYRHHYRHRYCHRYRHRYCHRYRHRYRGEQDFVANFHICQRKSRLQCTSEDKPQSKFKYLGLLPIYPYYLRR